MRIIFNWKNDDKILKKSILKFNSNKTYNNRMGTKSNIWKKRMKLKKLFESFKIKQLIIKRTMTMFGRKKNTIEMMLWRFKELDGKTEKKKEKKDYLC